MKLLLLAMLGLVAAATAQNAGEFVVIEEESDANDINVEDIEKLQGQGLPRRYASMMDPDAASKLKTACSEKAEEQCSPGYKSAIDNSSLAMFSDGDVRNDAWDTANSSVTTKAPGALTRRGRQTPTNLYFCPHRNLLLRWFPVYWGGNLINVCFVPWPRLQAITYAQCTTNNCQIRFGQGQCRPSCYRRRRVLVFCYNIRLRRWFWRWVIRNLPQSCRCSTC